MTGKTTEPTSVSGRQPNTHRLLWYALASRLLLLTLIILWRSLFSSYDTSAALNPPCLSTIPANSSSPSPNPPSVLLPRVGSAIENSVVWDSVHFIRIAECGFWTIGAGYWLQGCVGAIWLSSQQHSFYFAALYLYRFSITVLKDSEVALRASILFSLNPASIFYSSIYSESLYAILSFGGLYHFLNGAGYSATFWLALSGFTRSNGVLNAGYFCLKAMQRAYKAFFWEKKAYVSFFVMTCSKS